MGLGAVVVAWAAPADLALRRARLSLMHDRPESALERVSSWLAEHPDDAAALELRAEAQLALGRIDAAWDSLARALRVEPDRPTARRVLTEWVFRAIDRAVATPGFAISPGDQRRFDRALAVGYEQAEWLRRQPTGDVNTRSRFLQARLLSADLRRLRAIADAPPLYPAKTARTMTTDPTARIDKSSPPGDSVGSDVEGRIEARRAEIIRHLQAIVEADRLHYPAWSMYVDALAERGGEPYWEAAETLRSFRSLPADLGARIAETVLALPDPARCDAERIDLARRLLDAVTPAEQSRASWRKATARTGLRAGDVDSARHQLKILVRDFPPDPQTQALVARLPQ
jgi:tetratricopeptide (TPR) repeat protein